MKETLISILPAVNASLNGLAMVLLLIGFRLIHQKRIEAHRRVMLSAFAVSVVFLGCYLVYHGIKGDLHTRFEVEGWLQPTYYTILISHIILAAIVPVLAVITLFLGWKRRDAKHRRLAKFTWPIWIYVSVTGVIVYLMLYQLQPRLMSG